MVELLGIGVDGYEEDLAIITEVPVSKRTGEDRAADRYIWRNRALMGAGRRQVGSGPDGPGPLLLTSGPWLSAP